MFKQHLLPFYGSREGTKIDTIVIHCSNQDTAEMIEVLQKVQLSAHYIIGLKGEITQLVNEDEKAWHAGVSYWRGKENLNQNSIGIELSNLSLGQKPYNDEQIKSLISLLEILIDRYAIKAQNIVGHSDIAPSRKPDPGICFPWQQLAEIGIGLWYGDKFHPSDDVRELLNIIGYDTRTDEALLASAYAFRRRFLPEEVSVDEDVMHLVDNVYPQGDKSLLEGKTFLKVLKKVAYVFSRQG